MRRSTQLRDEMKRDLMRAYREESRKYDGFEQSAVYDMTVRHPAPRFYVDARRALQYISPMMRGDRKRLEELKPLRREMYEALFDIVMRLAQKERFWGKSAYCILRQAVMEPAPRFYINTRRMAQIYTEQIRKERRSRSEAEAMRKQKKEDRT